MFRMLLLGLGASTMMVSASAALDLRVAVANLPPYLDPGKDHSNTGSQVYYNAFDPLIEKDYSSAEANFRPGIATEWREVEPTVFEVELRSDVKFHNGATMTAEDVAFTFNRIIDEATPEFASVNKQFFANFDKVEVVDPTTVRFTTFKPEPLFETLLNTSEGSIVPMAHIMGLTGDPKVAEPADFDAFALARSGPARIRSRPFSPASN